MYDVLIDSIKLLLSSYHITINCNQIDYSNIIRLTIHGEALAFASSHLFQSPSSESYSYFAIADGGCSRVQRGRKRGHRKGAKRTQKQGIERAQKMA